MSDELSNQDNKKKIIKKKDVGLIENYQFKDDTAVLITDIPSSPLMHNIETETTTKKSIDIIELVSINMKKESKVDIKSNKELYESYIKNLKYYSLCINDDVIYDSSIDKSGNYPIIFENDYFILYGKKYSYNGLKVQKINVK